MQPPIDELLDILDRALVEDGAADDITCGGMPDLWKRPASAVIRARTAGIAAGFAVLPHLPKLEYLSRHEWQTPLRAELSVNDGGALAAGAVAARLSGSTVALLTLERSLLNLLSRLSGIATLTQSYVLAAGSRVAVCDTRKTTPGLRRAEKYAVHCGGGVNHRFGLDDEAMIKDNHLALAGVPLAAAVASVRAAIGSKRLTVEVDSLAQCAEALTTSADCVLLDNFTIPMLREAVAQRAALVARGSLTPQRIAFEASGGVTLATIGEIAQTGVERVSVGALTHSARALDLGLDIE